MVEFPERGIDESELVEEIRNVEMDVLAVNDKLQLYVGMDSHSEEDQLRMGELSAELTIRGCNLGVLRGLYQKYFPEGNPEYMKGIMDIVGEAGNLATLLMVEDSD